MTLPEHLLPPSMRLLAHSIGLPAVLKLIELRGGLDLYVPGKVTPDHWLVPHIGIDALHALVQCQGGNCLNIPRCNVAVTQIKAAFIAAESQHYNNTALAIRYGYTVRGIRKLLRRIEDRDNQGDLFD